MQTNDLVIRQLQSDLKKYKEINGQFKEAYFRSHNKAQERICKIIEFLRSNLKGLENKDDLKQKEELINDCTFNEKRKYISWYEDEVGDKSAYNDDTHTKHKENYFNCYLFPLHQESDYAKIIKANSEFYWLDELKGLIRNNGEGPLHHKFEYFRIGNEFYHRNKFFLFDNKAYDKQKYALSNGNLIDLSKVLRINSATRYSYQFHTLPFQTEKNYYLESEDDEKFENCSDAYDANCYLIIRLRLQSVTNSLLSEEFISTMFVANKKRFYNSRSGSLYISKEDLADLQLKPSGKHIKLYNEIEKNLLATYNTDNVTVINKDYLRAKIMEDIIFQVELNNNTRGNGIFEQIVKEIFPNKVNLCVKEMQNRLSVLKELFAKEKEYAK